MGPADVEVDHYDHRVELRVRAFASSYRRLQGHRCHYPPSRIHVYPTGSNPVDRVPLAEWEAILHIKINRNDQDLL
jgi:hypothetical protein